MSKFTGYGIHNDLLNELQELKDSATLRANDLRADELVKERAKATAAAYDYCMHRLMCMRNVPGANFG